MLQKKRKIKKRRSLKIIFFSAIFIFLILIFIGFLAISNWRINQKRAIFIKQIDDLERKIESLSARNNELKEGIRQIESNEYWEAKLYEQGYKKPGEEVLVILPPSEEKNELRSEEKGFWQKVRGKLGF